MLTGCAHCSHIVQFWAVDPVMYGLRRSGRVRGDRPVLQPKIDYVSSSPSTAAALMIQSPPVVSLVETSRPPARVYPVKTKTPPEGARLRAMMSGWGAWPRRALEEKGLL